MLYNHEKTRNNNRSFSEEFKRSKVKELEQKQITIPKLVSLYGISRSGIYKWIHKYSNHYQKPTRIVIEMESESAKTLRLQERVAEMERIIGQKQRDI